MDSSYNWATITFQTCTSLNIPRPPVEAGDVYTFKGPGGRRARNSVGTLRPRKTADVVRTLNNTEPGDNIGSIRGEPASGLDLEGIVTAKFADRIYVESPDRSSGAPVLASAAAQTFVTVGDRVWFTGDTALLDGQKQITPSSPFVIVSSLNPLPYLGIRTKDIGGMSYSEYDPGVTNGRGALNVGLYIKIHGLLTYKDTATTPKFFYIWDGANKTVDPVNDGNAEGANGIRINRAPTTAMTPWTSWVEVEGPVSVNQTAVDGSTIPEVIPAVAPVILAAGDFTTVNFPAGVVRGPGKNLIGVPYCPGDVGNGDAGGWGQAYDPVEVYSPMEAPELWEDRAAAIDGLLVRYESGVNGSKGYDMWSDPYPGQFGGVILGDGCWLTAPSAWTLSYKARVQNIAQWISPGAAGKCMIATPQNHDVMLDPVWYEEDPLTGVCMTDGGQILSLYNASLYGEGWIISCGAWWDNLASSMRDVGVGDDGAFDDQLRPWKGYWFTWTAGNADKSMIIP